MYATKKEIAAAISHTMSATQIEVVAFYSYEKAPGLDNALPQRVEWILVREKLAAAHALSWHVLRKINFEGVTLEFSRSEDEKSEAVFHWEANLKHLSA